MDFFSRLYGGSTHGPAKATPKAAAPNDPKARLARFKRTFNLVLELCNKPRDPANERPLLESLKTAVSRLTILIREDSRASLPHLCLQYAATSQIFTVLGRAATVSQYEPLVHSVVVFFAALVESEEEGFLSNASFAKSLMRLVTRVADNGNVLLSVDAETSVLELLFSISAKIRLQPEALPVWFRPIARPELDDVFVKEKRSFVGTTQKADFPLCYLLVDRVHHEGRIGDFARTGLLYIFEAMGRSLDLEEWVVSSDLPTLMASGLGALYSQLSRELSILHPNSTLPAVLAMSDYSTTHQRATTESAFSDRHQTHMATFLSYLAFWQDVLDHCGSADVKQTLLDHFQILFLQQLLYPSLLQSSDTDAGSSVAVLTYMASILDVLDHPDLINMILTYLLAVPESIPVAPSTPATPVRPSMPPRSPTATKKRQSLMMLTAPKDPDPAFEPALFNLTDLILNSVRSRGAQTAFSALKLISMMIQRQRKYAFGTLLKVRPGKSPSSRQQTNLIPGESLVVNTMNTGAAQDTAGDLTRTVGAQDLEVESYRQLATALHCGTFPEEVYASLCDDLRYCIEGQMQLKSVNGDTVEHTETTTFALSPGDPLVRSLADLLRTFLTNSVEVNLALTQALMSIASCVELKLDAWLALDPADYKFADAVPEAVQPWGALLEDDEMVAWFALQQASRQPTWSADKAPLIHTILESLVHELAHVRSTVPNLDHLLAGRQHMLQASTTPAQPASEPSSLISSPTQPSFLDAPLRKSKPQGRHSRSSSNTTSSPAQGRKAAHSRASSTQAASPSQTFIRPSDTTSSKPNASQATRSIFQPPPPETTSTTDVLMQNLTFPAIKPHDAEEGAQEGGERTASLNHVLTNIVVLQQFVLELVAVLQVRAAVLGDREVRYTREQMGSALGSYEDGNLGVPEIALCE
ncbi:hypothetical protein LTR33_011495 [Friedmanniomyces endolithicus]|nr:hypothetical protein LTR33_011495 [Friedmanniomyces endolithicus]